MKTIEIPRASAEIANLLAQADPEEGVVVRLGDGREFLLLSLDGFDQEVTGMRECTSLSELLDQRSASTTSVSINEVKRQLGL